LCPTASLADAIVQFVLLDIARREQSSAELVKLTQRCVAAGSLRHKTLPQLIVCLADIGMGNNANDDMNDDMNDVAIDVSVSRLRRHIVQCYKACQKTVDDSKQ
jgi:hypothetical protein